MTERELSKFYWLKKEIKDIENRIEEFGTGLSAMKIDDGIKKIGGKLNTVEEKYMELKEMYLERRAMALEEYIKIENYINSVDDPEIRLITRKRFLDLKNWEQIGYEMNYDRTVVAKKMRNYLKNNIAQKTH